MPAGEVTAEGADPRPSPTGPSADGMGVDRGLPVLGSGEQVGLGRTGGGDRCLARCLLTPPNPDIPAPGHPRSRRKPLKSQQLAVIRQSPPTPDKREIL